MKKLLNILVIISAVLALSISFNSCSDDDDYNYDKITPKVIGINGPTSVAANGFEDYPSTYNATYYRGGSTLEWTVTTESGVGSAIINTRDTLTMKGRYADIVFPQRSTADVATISVVEVSQGGVRSEAYEYEVALNPFCPQNIDYWVGTYTGTETIGTGDPEAISVTISKKDATTLVIEANAGTPGLLQSVYTGWGETFQAGFGLEGDIEVNYNAFTGALTLASGTYWGQTLPGPYDYWYTGSGSWDGCNDELTINFQMHWDDADFTDAGNRYCTAVLTKD